MKDAIFIHGNTPSSKNSRNFNIKTKRSFPSKQTSTYIKESKLDFENNKDVFLNMIKNKSKPYKIGLHFIRKSRHKYDWINPCQTVQDLMVRYGWIEDDNVTEMLPFPIEYEGSYTTYDTNNPGVYIKVL